MDILSLIILSFALAADAFAVSLCKGFSVKELKLKHYLIVGLYFGGFQALMPAIGYILGLKIGNKFGTYLKNKAEFIGGAILIFLAVKILLEHLYF